MFLLRRAALRAASSTTSIAAAAAKPRSFTSLSTSTTSSAFRSPRHQQWLAAQRRFQSDDAATKSNETAPASADAEDQSAVASAVSAAAETSTEQASVAAGESEIAETTHQADSASQTVAQTAAAAAGAMGGAAAAAGEAREPRQNTQFAPLDENKQTLYVGNLFWQTTEDRLRQEFSPFGNIVRAFVTRDNMGRSRGFGYVEFESADAAAQAIEQMNQRILDGRRLSVQHHRRREASDRREPRQDRLTRPRQPSQPSKTLFIGNMSFEMTDKDLTDLFREIRNVLDVRVAIDRRTGQPRGFAHADFIDETSATKAKEILQHKEVYGRKLRVDYSASSRSQDGYGRQQGGVDRQ